VTHTLRLIPTTVVLRDGTRVKACVEAGDPPHVQKMRQMKAAPTLIAALESVPAPPLGLMQMTREELADWGLAYLEWWSDTRAVALRGAR
jgi:hypothetical protein